MIDVNMLYSKWMGVALTAVFCFSVSACRQEDDSFTNVKTGLAITLTDEQSHAFSRTVPAELEAPLASAFNLRVTYAGTDRSAYKGKFSEALALKEGLYDITATYGDNPVLALDAPYYVGTLAGQEVITGRLTAASVPCEVANALLSVNFDEQTLGKVFQSYSVTVTVATEQVNIDSQSGKSAYFRAGSDVSLSFHGELNGTGKAVTFEIPHQSQFDNVAAKKHLVVTLGADTAPSGIGITVQKLEVQTVSINQTIPQEYMPKPKFESDDFTDNVLSFAETADHPAVIRLNLSAPLQDLKLTFHSDDAVFSGLKQDSPYQLSVAEDKAAVESALGIVLPEIGSTQCRIDLSSIIPRLMTQAGMTVSSTVCLDAKANNRWSSDKETDASLRTFTLKCEKPIFHIGAFPGDVWTRELAVHTLLPEDVQTGNYQKLASDMKYQFSTNPEEGWTDLQGDMRQTSLTPGTTYYIRGIYRDVVIGETVEVRTYENLTIPNSTLDEGYDTTYPKNKNPLYTFKGGWIGTRNPLTCHTAGVNAFYVSKSGTLPLSDNGSTVAHLMTLGWGDGNTCSFGNKSGSVIYHVSAGMVCVGDYSSDGDVVKPKEAYIRPTSLSFTYKAAPYGDDEYRVEAELINLTDGVETVVGSGTFQSATAVSSYQTQKVDITYDEEQKSLPVTHVRIVFKSGTKEDTDHLENKFRDASVWDGYSTAYIIGSQFWLDSFSLNYDK